jgi:hypothetical protein
MSASLFRLPLGRQRLWAALRVLKICDPVILAATACVAETTAREFLGLLVRGGYAVKVERGNGKAGALSRFKLTNNTGPKAPRRVFDFLEDGNTGALVPLAAAQKNRRPALLQRIAA